MVTLQIPNRITEGEELVLVPKKEYERILTMYKKYGWAEMELEADEDISKGRISVAYKSKKELTRALNKLK